MWWLIEFSADLNKPRTINIIEQIHQDGGFCVTNLPKHCQKQPTQVKSVRKIRKLTINNFTENVRQSDAKNMKENDKNQ